MDIETEEQLLDLLLEAHGGLLDAESRLGKTDASYKAVERATEAINSALRLVNPDYADE